MENIKIHPENIEPIENTIDDNKLNLSDRSKSYLSETRKWTLFLSILGFIYIGLIVVGALSMGAIMSKLPGDLGSIPSMLFSIVYLVLATVMFFPIYYLLQFSTKMKTALQFNNNTDIEDAFSNLKSHYKFYGIFIIVMLSFYIIVLIAMLIGSIFALSNLFPEIV